jgi:uncharacterized protein
MRRLAGRSAALAAAAIGLVAATAVGCRRGGDEAPRPAPSAQDPGEAEEIEHPVSAASHQPAEPGAEVVFRPRGAPEARVAVEVARTPRQIQLGLMYRTHLPPEAGMLFMFGRPKVQRFWMKNTLIPLDMIFVSSEMVVAGVVENAQPKTMTSRSVPGVVSQFVVEVNAGWAKAHGVEVGVPVEFVRVPAVKPTDGDIGDEG